MNLIKPKLVDYNLIKFPIKNKKIKEKIIKSDINNNKIYLNIFVIIIIFLGAYSLYYRMKNKEKVYFTITDNLINTSSQFNSLVPYINNSLNESNNNVE